MEGCDNVVGFKTGFGQYIKLVEPSKREEDGDALDVVVRKMRAEIINIPKQKDYCQT